MYLLACCKLQITCVVAARATTTLVVSNAICVSVYASICVFAYMEQRLQFGNRKILAMPARCIKIQILSTRPLDDSTTREPNQLAAANTFQRFGAIYPSRRAREISGRHYHYRCIIINTRFEKQFHLRKARPSFSRYGIAASRTL